MKTIDINLLGDLGKTPVKAKKQSLQAKHSEEEDPKLKFMSIAVVVGASLVFAIALLVWLTAVYSVQKNTQELAVIQSRNELLKKELAKYNRYQKDLQFEKKVLDMKLVAKAQIDDSILPWCKVLGYVGINIPKSLKLTKITKSNISGDANPDATTVEISGQVYNKPDFNPLEEVSFFILNLNEARLNNPPLMDATVKEVHYDDKEDKYNFVVQSYINKPKRISENKS